VAPVRAADTEDTKIVTIDSRQGDLPTLLSADDNAKIAKLQNGATRIRLFSDISPDDQAILVQEGNVLGFLNIQNGSFLRIDPKTAFSRFFPAALLGRGGGFVWRDNRTLVSLGTVDPGAFSNGEDEPNQGAPPEAALVSIDRMTGQVNGVAINLPDALPFSIAPNARRVLLQTAPPDSDAQGQTISVPVTWPKPSASAAIALPADVQAEADRFLQDNAYLRRLTQWNPPTTLERSVLSVASKETKLQIFDVASGQTTDLFTVHPGTIFSPVVPWTADGGKIALTYSSMFDFSDPPDPRASRTQDGALLSEQLYKDVTGNLPPADNPFFQHDTVEVFDLDGQTTKTLRAADGDGVLLGAEAWSPDGQALLVRALHPAHIIGRRYPIYTPQLAERASFRLYDQNLTEIGRTDAPDLAGPSGLAATFATANEIVFTAITGLDLHLYLYNRSTGNLQKLTTQPGTYNPVAATRTSRQIVFGYTSFVNPGELYRMSLDGTDLTPLSAVNKQLAALSKTQMNPVTFRLASGALRTGMLIQPAGTTFPPSNVPMIVWQEGGPGGFMNNEWAANVENPYALLPNFGFSLLIVPLSGREGYGPATLNALADGTNFGQIDEDEMAEIVQQAVARGWTSPRKLGITGCSYGGYFALQSVIRHPDLYAAANPQCALVDSIVEWSRGMHALMPFLEGRPPFSALDEYRRDSPMYNAGTIRAAVLTFHGTDDFLPITQNENLHLQLVLQGVPARMVRFVGAGHGVVSRSRATTRVYQLYAAQEMIQWFRTYLR
jgi:dipeptidyl aminopeptidase/acylaminoacyl peptidase